MMNEEKLSEIKDLLWEIRELSKTIEKYPLGDDPMEK